MSEAKLSFISKDYSKTVLILKAINRYDIVPALQKFYYYGLSAYYNKQTSTSENALREYLKEPHIPKAYEETALYFLAIQNSSENAIGYAKSLCKKYKHSIYINSRIKNIMRENGH